MHTVDIFNHILWLKISTVCIYAYAITDVYSFSYFSFLHDPPWLQIIHYIVKWSLILLFCSLPPSLQYLLHLLHITTMHFQKLNDPTLSTILRHTRKSLEPPDRNAISSTCSLYCFVCATITTSDGRTGDKKRNNFRSGTDDTRPTSN